MTAPARDLPNWLPASIGDAARYLPPSEVVERLLTDMRMRSVWAFLMLQKPDSDAVDRHLFFEEALPAVWGQEFSPQERAAAAFLCSIAGSLARALELTTRAEADARAAPFLSAAKVCREMIPHAEGFQRGFDEVGEPLDFDLEKAFAIVAGILESKAKRISATNDPHIIERSAKERGDDELRVKARTVAKTMLNIYRQRNYGLTSTITSVATGLAVTKKQAENWTADLTSVGKPKP